MTPLLCAFALLAFRRVDPVPERAEGDDVQLDRGPQGRPAARRQLRPAFPLVPARRQGVRGPRRQSAREGRAGHAAKTKRPRHGRPRWPPLKPSWTAASRSSSKRKRKSRTGRTPARRTRACSARRRKCARRRNASRASREKLRQDGGRARPGRGKRAKEMERKMSELDPRRSCATAPPRKCARGIPPGEPPAATGASMFPRYFANTSRLVRGRTVRRSGRRAGTAPARTRPRHRPASRWRRPPGWCPRYPPPERARRRCRACSRPDRIRRALRW